MTSLAAPSPCSSAMLPPPPPPRPATSSGLGGGAIFGIVLAVLICLGVLAFGGLWGYKRIQAEAEGDNPI